MLVGFGYVCIGGADFNGGFCLNGVFQRQWVVGFLGSSGLLGFISMGFRGLSFLLGFFRFCWGGLLITWLLLWL